MQMNANIGTLLRNILPEHVCINDLVVTCTAQADVFIFINS